MLAALWSAGGPGPRDLIFSSLFFGNTRSINQAKERVFPGCLGRDGRAKEDSRRVGWVEGPTLPLSCSSRLALPSHHWDSRRVGWVEGPTLPLSCSSRLALPSHHWDSRRVGWVEGPTLPLSCSSRLALPSHHWPACGMGGRSNIASLVFKPPGAPVSSLGRTTGHECSVEEYLLPPRPQSWPAA
ncbi:uncharacterized protein LOC126989091 isoform X20 [Eriocheir sinensis]|uniref:uncharacterized protein LOC126989091 isoform X19 n=2 Tax=Eriocheir sinensis TaxID=95602 RepID=UPI0021C80088|nr:uncharacterized protein LOC126989091 isoform X19 [Eriocheir sinensis]XP_050703713.1 uncharacterized protein LOC126989091 isoform X20 [Eriocheir sinensis]